MALNIQKIQRGLVRLTSATGAAVTATVSDFDIVKTMLLFTYRSNTAASIYDSVRGMINSSTQIQFESSSAPTGVGMQWIEWVLVTFSPDSDITVQHGTTNGGAEGTITAVTLANAFVMASFDKAGSSTFGGDDMGWAQLTSTTKVTFYQGATHDDDTYQVVSSPHFKVQELQKIKTSGTTQMVTIPTAISLTKTIISPFCKMTNGSTNTVTFNQIPSFSLSSANQIYATTYQNGPALDHLVYVVELSGNNKVRPTTQQCSYVEAAAGTISGTVAINEVNTNSSFLKTFGIIQGLYTSNASNDNRYLGQHTLNFESSTSTLYRRSIAGQATAAVSKGSYGVVELEYAPTIVFFNAHLRSAYNKNESVLAWSVVDGKMLGPSKFSNNTFRQGSGTTWSTFMDASAGGSFNFLSAGPDDQYVKIDVTDTGDFFYSIQFNTDGKAFILRNGFDYLYTYKIKSDLPTSARSYVELNGAPYTLYSRTDVNTTSAWQVVSKQFTMAEATTSAARLNFQIGKSRITSFYIDDVYLHEIASNNMCNTPASIAIYNNNTNSYLATGLSTSGTYIIASPQGVTRYTLSARNDVGWSTWTTIVSAGTTVVTSAIGGRPIFKTYGYGLMMPMTYALQGVNL